MSILMDRIYTLIFAFRNNIYTSDHCPLPLKQRKSPPLTGELLQIGSIHYFTRAKPKPDA
jgi:hypothetical protein